MSGRAHALVEPGVLVFPLQIGAPQHSSLEIADPSVAGCVRLPGQLPCNVQVPPTEQGESSAHQTTTMSRADSCSGDQTLCSSARGTTYSARPTSSSTSSVTNSHTSSLGYVFCVAQNRMHQFAGNTAQHRTWARGFDSMIGGKTPAGGCLETHQDARRVLHDKLAP